MLQFTDGGLRNIWLDSGYDEKVTAYGKAVSFQDVDGLTKAICKVLVKKPAKLSGREFRYLRSNLSMSQKSLGSLLGCSEQAVAKWEKLGRVPKAEDYLLRLIYAQRHDDADDLDTTVELLTLLNQVCHAKVILSYAGTQWTARATYFTNENDAASALPMHDSDAGATSRKQETMVEAICAD